MAKKKKENQDIDEEMSLILKKVYLYIETTKQFLENIQSDINYQILVEGNILKDPHEQVLDSIKRLKNKFEEFKKEKEKGKLSEGKTTG